MVTFLTDLHQPAPSGATAGRDRGGPLADRADQLGKGLASAAERGLITDPDAVRVVWHDAVTAPQWTGPALWLHADLHPANVLTAEGTFCGVIDFGDSCAGDPACDLAAVWLLLPDGTTDHFYAAYQPTPDTATMRRACGWAMARALDGILIGDAGVHGRPGGKPTWGPPTPPCNASSPQSADPGGRRSRSSGRARGREALTVRAVTSILARLSRAS